MIETSVLFVDIQQPTDFLHQTSIQFTRIIESMHVMALQCPQTQE